MGFIETLISWDKKTFLELNGLHTNWMDHFMWLMSETVVWLPFFLCFLYLLIRNKKSKSLLLILVLALLITFTDQIASGVFKPLIERFRPTHDVHISSLVHVVHNYKGGHYGFFSSHAANVFAFAGLSLLLIRHWLYTVCILIWATLIAYSRIYLGVHFPLDILTGAVFGMLSSVGFYHVYKLISKDKSMKTSGKIRKSRKSTDGYTQEDVYKLSYSLAIILTVCLLSSYYLAW